MILFEVGSIVSPGTEAIVNAANGCGIMGAGVAGAISRACGPYISEETKLVVKENGGPFNEGSCYVTSSGELINKGVKKIYHAVTMKYPGGNTSLDFVNKAMRATLIMAIKDEIESIAFPGLGIGIGGLNRTLVAGVMLKIAREYDHLINIVFIDINKDFIEELEDLSLGGSET